MIDLRSDTVTRPGEAMRRAMYEAEVGDDVFGEDPTVRRLEEKVAEILGKERALFVPSGTMGNQLAIRAQTSPGDEVIVDRMSHIFNYESAGAAQLSGVQLQIVDGRRGLPDREKIEAAVRPGHYWEPQSRLVCLENTVNKAGGTIIPAGVAESIAGYCRERGLRLHLDGARLWNASIATGRSEASLAAPFDTVNVCLSKGLGAPAGSVLAGDDETIRNAHRFRKMFGGGMRQVGILAAAGLYAIEHHRELLNRDHEKARKLAETIASLDGFAVDLDAVQTNIVMFDCERDVSSVLEMLQADGILMIQFGPKTIRATTHLDVSMDEMQRVVDVLRSRFSRISATTISTPVTSSS
jgi:threonine aldolase